MQTVETAADAKCAADVFTALVMRETGLRASHVRALEREPQRDAAFFRNRAREQFGLVESTLPLPAPVQRNRNYEIESGIERQRPE